MCVCDDVRWPSYLYLRTGLHMCSSFCFVLSGETEIDLLCACHAIGSDSIDWLTIVCLLYTLSFSPFPLFRNVLNYCLVVCESRQYSISDGQCRMHLQISFHYIIFWILYKTKKQLSRSNEKLASIYFSNSDSCPINHLMTRLAPTAPTRVRDVHFVAIAAATKTVD